MKIRILLYKTPKKWGFKYLVNHLISARTWSKYSHIEIWTPDGSDRVYSPPAFTEMGALPAELIIFGTCYTSTMRGEANGTVGRPASGVLDHPENWDYIEIPLTDKQHEILVWWLERKVAANKGYSKHDILKYVSPVHFPDDTRDICSELINNGLVIIRVILGFGIVSPGKVCKKLVKKGYVVKKLA